MPRRSSRHPRPPGLDPPARQAAGRHPRRADDRACLAARDGGRDRPGAWSPAPSRRSPTAVERGRRRGGADPARPSVRLRPHLRGGRAARSGAAGYDAVINVQGDLPTARSGRDARRAGAAGRSGRRHRHPRRADRRSGRERDDPNMVKAACRWLDRPAAVGRALYFSRAAVPSGEGPLYHHIGIYAYRRGGAGPLRRRCRRACSSSASGWSSCARWRPACASTSPSLTRFRSASILRPIWRAPGRCSAATGSSRPARSAARRPGEHHRLPGRARRLLRPRLPHRPPRPGDAALRLLRGRLRRRARGPRRAGDDPDRELGRRPRRRHPPPDAGLRPAHHRRAFPAGEPSPAGAARGAPRATSRRCTATSTP